MFILFGNIMTVILVKKFGKHYLMFFSLCICIVADLIVELVWYLNIKLTDQQLVYIMIISYIMVLLTLIGLEPVAWILVAEMFPAK